MYAMSRARLRPWPRLTPREPPENTTSAASPASKLFLMLGTTTVRDTTALENLG